jgi:hypothetical protein
MKYESVSEFVRIQASIACESRRSISFKLESSRRFSGDLAEGGSAIAIDWKKKEFLLVVPHKDQKKWECM